MGIDRIGRGGPPPAPTPARPARGTETTAAFEVRPTHTSPTANLAAANAPAQVAPAMSALSPLERLQSGEIDLDRYLDLKVDQATAHLHGLGGHELEGLRLALRHELASDPGLAALVQSASAGAPRSGPSGSKE
jgi:hypothetical protein